MAIGPGERIATVRAQQQGPSPSPADIEAYLADVLDAHAEHPWHKVGRCVYCGPCRVRLYQGDMPKDHEVWKPPRKPSAADKMREKWGKA